MYIQTKNFFFIIVLFSIAAIINSHNPKPTIELSKQETVINFNSKILTLFNVGQQRLIVSILWIKTLIESDEEQFKKSETQNASWMYLRFDTITTLDPKFLQAYQYGGQYLSIIKDDDDGALNIFLKGIDHYPLDYFLNYNLAYHYYFELNQVDNALIYFEKIKNYPEAPTFISSLVARLKAEKGDIQTALQLILENYNKTPKGSELSKHLEASLYSINTEVDLNCLNNQKVNCKTRDLYGELYLKSKKGDYVAPREYKPFRIFKIK